MHNHGDLGMLAVGRVGELGQPGLVAGGEETRGSNPNREHVGLSRRDLQMNVQSPRVSVGDEEEFAIVLAAEIASTAGAQVALDEARAERVPQRPSHRLILRPWPGRSVGRGI